MTGLNTMREKRGLTQRQLAKDLSISQNDISAMDANSRQVGPKLHDPVQLGYRYEDLLETILANPESGQERRLVAKT